jgi:hypothetical protein
MSFDVIDWEGHIIPQADSTGPDQATAVDNPLSDSGDITFGGAFSGTELPPMFHDLNPPAESQHDFLYYPVEADQQLELPANDHFEALFTNDDYRNEIARQGGLIDLVPEMGDEFIISTANRALVDHVWPMPDDQADGTYDTRRDAISEVLFRRLSPSETEFFQNTGQHFLQLQNDRARTRPDWMTEQDVKDVPELALKAQYINQGRQYADRNAQRLNRPVAKLSDDQLETLGRTLESRHREIADDGAPKAPDSLPQFVWDSGKLFLGGAADGTMALNQGVYHQIGTAIAELAPNNPTAQKIARGFDYISRDIGQRRQGYAQVYKVNPEFARSLYGQILTATGRILPLIATSELPGLNVLVANSQSFQDAWDDAEEVARRKGEPFDPHRVFAYATTMGVINASLNLVKVDKMMRPWLKTAGPVTFKKALLETVKGSLVAGGVSVAQGATNDAVTSAYDIDSRNPFDPEKRATDFVVGSLTTLPVAVLGVGGRSVVNNKSKIRNKLYKSLPEVTGKKLRRALPWLLDGREVLLPPPLGSTKTVKTSGKIKYEAPFVPENNPDQESWIIAPSGSIDWGNITKEMSVGTKGELQPYPVRVQYGFHAEKNVGFGWVHAEDHTADFFNNGYPGQEAFLADVLANFNEIWAQNNGKLLLVKYPERGHKMKDVAVIRLEEHDGFYGVTTGFPEKVHKDFATGSKEAKKIWP